ncbi:hypothetical protein BH09DEP1_BH09DEP1_0590 [soil metagenome]
MNGIKTLAAGKSFPYHTYDWQIDGPSAKPTTIAPEGIIIVEGVSALNTELAPLYYKKIWVESDRESEFAAIAERENEKNLDVWKNIYIPSVDIYCSQKPWKRAHITYAGRGIQIVG